MEQTIDILRQPLVLPIAVSLAAGAAAYALSRPWPWVSKALALATGLFVLVAGVALLASRGTSFRWVWASLTDDVVLAVDLAPTTLGMLVLIAAAAFAVLIGVYSLRAMAASYWEGKFYAYLIWALSGTVIVALAANLLVLLVGWELVTLMLYLMVNQGSRSAPAGAAKAYGILGFADACLLLAVALLMGLEGGSANLSLMRPAVVVGQMGATGYLIYALILVAALAKAGAVPLHTWIPAIATEAPAPVMALLPAALDKLLGIYLLAVLALRMFQPDWTLQVIMMTIGAVTILAAVLMAMMQHNLKRLLSFHAVSQVGYMVLGIGTGTAIGVVGGLFHMLNHAIYKSNLFLMSGAVRRAAGTDQIEDLGGLARVLPVTFVSGLVAAAAISGIPPLNGFASKWLIYEGTLKVSANSPGLAVALVTVAVFGSALTLASFVKVMYSAFLSPRPRQAGGAGPRPRESVLMAAPMVVLAAACVVLGVWPQLVVQGVLAPAVAGASGQITDQAGGLELAGLGLWNPSQATVLLLIGIFLGLVLVYAMTRRGRVRVVRPFLSGEVPAAGDDRFRVPGTAFYKTVSQLPVLRPLLEQGEQGAMDPYHWWSLYGYRFVQVLRGFHTGLINLYVAWCLVGLTVTLVYLLLSTR